VTNDTFQNHVREGEITQDWFDAHVVSYLWIASTNRLMLNLPHDANLPHLQGGV
jgi:hypothetical protein